MKASISKSRRATGGLEQCIDPRAQVIGTIVVILNCLKAAGFEEDPGSTELSKAKRCAFTLLRCVRELNRMAFWKSLTLPRLRKSESSETIQNYRTEVLMNAREDLQGGHATRAGILAAMDAVHEVVAGMSTSFATGRVRAGEEMDDSWNLDRYTCASLLPALAEQLNSFWIQLRKDCAPPEK